MAMNNKTTKTCPVCETQNTVVINQHEVELTNSPPDPNNHTLPPVHMLCLLCTLAIQVWYGIKTNMKTCLDQECNYNLQDVK